MHSRHMYLGQAMHLYLKDKGTYLPNFFCTKVVSFFMIGFITLNNNGVAAAPAVANTAIATVVVDCLPPFWFKFFKALC